MALSGWLHRLWKTAKGSSSTGAVLPLAQEPQAAVALAGGRRQQKQHPTRRRVAALAAAAVVSLCVLGAFYHFLIRQPTPTHELDNDGSHAQRRFGIVIDAGSSGSRVMIYAWDDPAMQLEQLANKTTEGTGAFHLPAIVRAGEHWAFKTEPGISSFASDAQHVGALHIKPLLDFAQQQIPADRRASTPVLLLATAGMRLLQPAQRTRIMAAACAYARENYAFAVDDCAQSFRVVSGEHEGLFGWLAANYLLGALDGQAPTLGFLDMGGASAQIAFETASEDVAQVTLRALDGRDRTFGVFSATFLGHGTNEARRRYVAGLVPPTADPCLAPGLRMSTANGGELHGLGSFDACVASTQPLLNKTAACAHAPCLFAGVSAPPIDFLRQQFVGVSEYWYAAHEFLALGGAWDAARFEQRAREFCSTPWDKLLSQYAGDAAHVHRLQMQCFKAAWLVNVLHKGFGLPREAVPEKPQFRSLESVNGVEVSWTLGALLLRVSQTLAPAVSSQRSHPGIRLPAMLDAGSERWLVSLATWWTGLSLVARAALVASMCCALLLAVALAWRWLLRRRALYKRVSVGTPTDSPIALDVQGIRQNSDATDNIDAEDSNAKELRRSPSAFVLDMLPRPLHSVLSPPAVPSSPGFLSPLSASAASDVRSKSVAIVAETPPISRASSFSSLAMLNRRRGGAG